MATATLTLTEFLLARIAEDERACGGGDEPQNWCDRATGLHMSPGRVLAECEAKRQIVKLHKPYDLPTFDDCSSCGDVPQVDYPCPTLRAVAAVYADHPDYRDEWRA